VKCFLSIIILLAALATLPSRTAAEDLSTSGWRLWPDRDAAWTNDTLYLPSEIKLDQMPVNPPTDGWPALNDQQGMAVTLPSMVEEHYWGKFDTRPYAHNEAQRGLCKQVIRRFKLAWRLQLQDSGLREGKGQESCHRIAKIRI
jgi:hypothetical protein